MQLQENRDHSQDKDQKQPSTPNNATNFLQNDTVNVRAETVHCTWSWYHIFCLGQAKFPINNDNDQMLF